MSVSPRSAALTVFLYVVVCLIWGSTWLAIKLGLEGVPPFLGAGLRFVIAAAVLWAMVLVAKVSPRLSRDGRRAALTSGVLGFGIGYALVYWSETRVPSGLVASLFALAPLVTAILTVFVARTERLTPAKAAGILTGIAGTVVIFWPEKGVAGADPWGLLAALASSLCSAVNLVAQSLWSRRDDARVINAWAMSLGAAMLMTLSFLLERRAAAAWTVSNAGALFYLATVGSVAAFLIYFRLIRTLPATQVSFITLIIPVVALALGRAVLGEVVTLRAQAGVALILGGVVLALRTGGLR